MKQSYAIAPPPIIYEIIDDEVVILNLETGVYYNLNSSGTKIWRLIEQGAPFSEIVDSFTGDSREIEKETEAFLSELLREKIIFPAHPTQKAIPISRCPYQKPLLHCHQDMKELLLLDPIHEVDQTGWPVSK